MKRDKRHVDLWGWVCHLDHMVSGYRGAVDPQLKRALDDLRGVDDPPLTLLEPAARAWEEMPLEERKAICRGWNPDAPDPAVRDAMEATILWTGMQKFLCAEGGSGEFSAQVGPSADHGGSLTAVEVRILHGTPREQALAELRTITQGVEKHWDDLVSSPAESQEGAPAELGGNALPIEADDGCDNAALLTIDRRNGLELSHGSQGLMHPEQDSVVMMNFIRHGARQDEVLRGLDVMRRAVRDRWPELRAAAAQG